MIPQLLLLLHKDKVIIRHDVRVLEKVSIITRISRKALFVDNDDNDDDDSGWTLLAFPNDFIHILTIPYGLMT